MNPEWIDAEAVAARLVEVICEQERTLDLALEHWRDDVRSTRTQVAADIEEAGRVYEKVVALTAVERRMFKHTVSRDARIARGGA